jgi:hypothetical protein
MASYMSSLHQSPAIGETDHMGNLPDWVTGNTSGNSTDSSYLHSLIPDSNNTPLSHSILSSMYGTGGYQNDRTSIFSPSWGTNHGTSTTVAETFGGTGTPSVVNANAIADAAGFNFPTDKFSQNIPQSLIATSDLDPKVKASLKHWDSAPVWGSTYSDSYLQPRQEEVNRAHRFGTVYDEVSTILLSAHMAEGEFDPELYRFLNKGIDSWKPTPEVKWDRFGYDAWSYFLDPSKGKFTYWGNDGKTTPFHQEILDKYNGMSPEDQQAYRHFLQSGSRTGSNLGNTTEKEAFKIAKDVGEKLGDYNFGEFTDSDLKSAFDEALGVSQWVKENIFDRDSAVKPMSAEEAFFGISGGGTSDNYTEEGDTLETVMGAVKSAVLKKDDATPPKTKAEAVTNETISINVDMITKKLLSEVSDGNASVETFAHLFNIGVPTKDWGIPDSRPDLKGLAYPWGIAEQIKNGEKRFVLNESTNEYELVSGNNIGDRTARLDSLQILSSKYRNTFPQELLKKSWGHFIKFGGSSKTTPVNLSVGYSTIGDMMSQYEFDRESPAEVGIVSEEGQNSVVELMSDFSDYVGDLLTKDQDTAGVSKAEGVYTKDNTQTYIDAGGNQVEFTFPYAYTGKVESSDYLTSDVEVTDGMYDYGKNNITPGWLRGLSTFVAPLDILLSYAETAYDEFNDDIKAFEIGLDGNPNLYHNIRKNDAIETSIDSIANMGSMGSWAVLNAAFKKVMGSSITESLTDFMLTYTGVDKLQTVSQIQDAWHDNLRATTAGDAVGTLISSGGLDFLNSDGSISDVWNTAVRVGTVAGGGDPLEKTGFVFGDFLFGISPQGNVQKIGVSFPDGEVDYDLNSSGGGIVEKSLTKDGYDLTPTDGVPTTPTSLINTQEQSPSLLAGGQSDQDLSTSQVQPETSQNTVGTQQVSDSPKITTGLLSNQMQVADNPYVGQDSGLQLTSASQVAPITQGLAPVTTHNLITNQDTVGGVQQQPAASTAPKFEAPQFGIPQYETPQFGLPQFNTSQSETPQMSVNDVFAQATQQNLQAVPQGQASPLQLTTVDDYDPSGLVAKSMVGSHTLTPRYV